MQMQVIVPAGVGPGMSFIVNTPSGQQMQVVCPPNATAGSPMIVNVPQQAQAAQKLREAMKVSGSGLGSATLLLSTY